MAKYYGISEIKEAKEYCMTLFIFADPSLEIFGKVLDKFYGGHKDKNTIKEIQQQEWENHFLQ